MSFPGAAAAVSYGAYSVRWLLAVLSEGVWWLCCRWWLVSIPLPTIANGVVAAKGLE